MPHSYSRIWIHAIWSTKKCDPYIHPSIEGFVFEKMKNVYTAAGCIIKIINGMPDHVHSLFTLNPKRPVTEVIQLVKGNSSNWFNEQEFISQKFAWQTGFAAYSVSEYALNRVYQHILRQKEHHKKRTFNEEYIELVRLHGFN